MAHTTPFKHNGKEARIIANGDFSGMATVIFTDDAGKEQRVQVPGVAFIAGAREILSGEAEGMIERTMSDLEQRAMNHGM